MTTFILPPEVLVALMIVFSSIVVRRASPNFASRSRNLLIRTTFCSNLESITIPDSVNYIGQWVFAYCSNLTSVTIPYSVNSIDEYAFYGCSGLTSVTCLATTPPTLGSNNFTADNDTLYVPEECKPAYVATTWGTVFGEDHIKELE